MPAVDELHPQSTAVVAPQTRKSTAFKLDPSCVPFTPKYLDPAAPSTITPDNDDHLSWVKMLYQTQNQLQLPSVEGGRITSTSLAILEEVREVQQPPAHPLVEKVHAQFGDGNRQVRHRESKQAVSKVGLHNANANANANDGASKKKSAESKSKSKRSSPVSVTKNGKKVSNIGPPPSKGTICFGHVREMRGKNSQWGFIRDDRPQYAGYDLFFHTMEVQGVNGDGDGDGEGEGDKPVVKIRRGSKVTFQVMADQWQQEYDYARVKAVAVVVVPNPGKRAVVFRSKVGNNSSGSNSTSSKSSGAKSSGSKNRSNWRSTTTSTGSSNCNSTDDVGGHKKRKRALRRRKALMMKGGSSSNSSSNSSSTGRILQQTSRHPSPTQP